MVAGDTLRGLLSLDSTVGGSPLAYCFTTRSLSLLEQLSDFLEIVTGCRCLK